MTFPLFYRNGPNTTEPYGLSPHYWHVFAARLAFVVVFEVSTIIIHKQMKFNFCVSVIFNCTSI